MVKVIVITSGKGGVGKTTTAVNLGAALHGFGKDVVLIDGNLTTPNVGLHLGSPEVPVSLNHVLMKNADIYEAIYEHESGLKIIPSSLSIKDLKKLDLKKMKSLKKDLNDLSEFVIIDSSAGLGEEAMSAIDLADELIVITNPEMPAITDALKAIKFAEEKKKPVRGVIMTRVRRNKSEMQPDEVRDMLESEVLGMIPEDIIIQESLRIKHPVVHAFPKSKSARAYKEIAANLIDEDYDSSVDRENIFERIARIFGKRTKI
ncbi:MAG: cell division ATPase MinD [Nanoarchaeota archaeon]